MNLALLKFQGTLSENNMHINYLPTTIQDGLEKPSLNIFLSASWKPEWKYYNYYSS